jgi:SAM-dependent methyltransferase
MSFETLKETWNQLGEVDPLWAILTRPDAEGGRWDLQQFLASGKDEIACALEEIRLLEFPLTFGKALDFGCGVGRLTQALGGYFEECHGVDISSSMIDLANKLNNEPARIIYHLNQREDLGLFPDNSFDFIYSRIVLQHMAPVYSKKYMAEFIRLLKPGGLAAFQVPAGAVSAAGTGQEAVDGLLRPSGRFAAFLTLAETALVLQPNEQRELTIRVQNASRAIWSSEDRPGGRSAVSLGNHWLGEDGRIIQLDDGRTPLPITLRPGEMAEVGLTVTAPQAEGHYWLELDLVQEDVAWFSDKGNQGPVIPVTVPGLANKLAAEPEAVPVVKPPTRLARFLGRLRREQRLPAEAKPQPGAKLQFEMHGVLPAEIIKVIQASRGRLVAVQQDGSAGRDWRSYFYYATK